MLMTINYCECCSNSWVESIIVLVTAEQKVLVWRSVDAFDSINVVTLHRARLVAGWVTVFGRVNYLGTEPSTQAYSARAIPPWVGRNEYWLWLQPLLGKKRVLRNSSPVTRTAGILAYSRLKALAVNGASHPAEIGRMPA